MKRVLAFLLLTGVLFTMGACTSAEDNTEESETKESETKESESMPMDESFESDSPKSTEKVAAKWEEDGFLKILTIGNSFSDDTMEHLYSIAKSAGVKKIKLGNLYIGGCSVDLHVSNAIGDKGAYDYRTNSDGTWKNQSGYKMSDALRSENWDFISLQQASGSSGMQDSYGQLDYLIAYVKDTANADAKIVWNMTWAYQQNSTHGEFYKYENSQSVMYDKIIEALEGQIDTKEDITQIIPNGTAIQNARTSFVGDTLTRDGFHLSLGLGRYIAGLTFFHKLTGMPIKDIEFRPESVDEEHQKIAIESAMNAVKSPRRVTQSEYTERAPIDLSKYTKLDLSWTLHGYWNSGSGNKTISTTDKPFCTKYCASRLISKEELPEGSIIVLAEGWKYRPDAWPANSGRPVEVTEARTVVSNSWWGGYTERGFNVSKIDNSYLSDLTLGELENVLVIYVPKK